jgi:hypothetical protein
MGEQGLKSLFAFFHKSIFIIFILVFIVILSLNIFFSRGFHSTELPTPPEFNFITLFVGVSLSTVIYFFRFKINSLAVIIPSKYTVLILLLISVSLQLLAVKFLSVNPSWDFGEIFRNSQVLVKGGELNEYFTMYPNNIFLVCLLAIVGKIFTSSLITYQLINIFIITLSQYLIFRISSKVVGKSLGILSLLVSVFYFPYIFYSPIVYTDTISLLFLMLPLNILIASNGSFKGNPTAIITASILFSLGTLLKGSLIIFVIAYSLVIFLFFTKWKKSWFLVPFLSFAVVSNLFNYTIYENGIIDQKKVEKLSFPVTHWIMMGQNEVRFGKYAAEDVVMTDQLLHTTSRKKVVNTHLQELLKRIEEKGWQGNLHYNIEKLSHTWTDGTYYSLNKLKRIPFHPENYQRLIDSNSGYLLQSYARIQHLFILVGILFFLLRVRQKSEFFTFAMLSVIGFFFFFILWEARSRYLVSLTPLLIICSCVGYSVLDKKRMKKSQNTNDVNLDI